MPSPVRIYAGKSAESRIDARRRQLIDAAFGLMADEGWPEASIGQLCREAGLNKRYFYEHFTELAEVECAVIDDLAAQLVVLGLGTARAGRKDGRDPGVLARDTMAVVLGFLVNDPRRARVLLGKVGGSPRATTHRVATLRTLTQQIATYGHEFHHAKKKLPAADVSAAMLVGGTVEIVSSWLDGEIAMSLEELVEHVAGLWVYVSEGTVVLAGGRPKPAD